MSDQRLRHEHDGEGVGQRRQTPGRQAGGDDGVHQEVDLDDPDAQQAGRHQAKHLAHRPIREAERRVVACLPVPQAGQLNHQVQGGAQDIAPGQAVDPHPRNQEDNAEDHPQVAHRRRQRRQQEMLVRVEDAHQQSAQAEQDRRQKLDPQKLDCQGDLAGIVEARGDDVSHKPRGEHEDQRGKRRQRQEDQVGDRRGQSPGGGTGVPRQQGREGRYEGGGQRPAGEQAEEQGRQAQGGEVLVSNVVRELVAGKGFLFSDRGEMALRGFEDPVRAYDVRWRE